MLAWEHQLADMIDVKRREEMKLLNNFKSWQTVLSLLFGGSATAIVQLATFSAYILLGGQLTAGIVFSSLAIFDMLQLPMSLLPITVQYLAQTYVSVLRIEKLLRAEEVGSPCTRGQFHSSPTGECGRQGSVGTGPNSKCAIPLAQNR